MIALLPEGAAPKGHPPALLVYRRSRGRAKRKYLIDEEVKVIRMCNRWRLCLPVWVGGHHGSDRQVVCNLATTEVTVTKL